MEIAPGPYLIASAAIVVLEHALIVAVLVPRLADATSDPLHRLDALRELCFPVMHSEALRRMQQWRGGRFHENDMSRTGARGSGESPLDLVYWAS